MSKRILSVLCAVALLVMTFSGGFAVNAANVGDNLITNGTFATDISGWTTSGTAPISWSNNSGNQNNALADTGCIVFFYSDVIVSQKVTLSANSSYQLSGYMNNPSATSRGIIGIKDPSGNVVPDSEINSTSIGKSVYYTYFNTGSTAGDYTVYLKHAATENVYFDDIRLIYLGTTSITGLNLIENGGFENGPDPVSGVLKGNGYYGWSHTGNGFNRVTTPVVSGSTKAIDLRPSDITVSQRVVLVAGHTYTFKGYVQIPTGQTVTATLGFKTLAGVDLANSVFTVTANGAYTQYSSTFAVATTATYQLTIKGNVTWSHIYLDNLELADKGTGGNDATITAGTGGTVTGTAKYSQGDTVTITATPDLGYTFANWTVLSGGVTLANANSASTSFTMPNNAVSVQANFTRKPYLVTINPTSAGTITGNTYYNAGDTVTVKAVPNNGYVFSKWLVISGGVTLATVENIQTTFTMPSGDVEVRPVFKANLIQNGDFETGNNTGWTVNNMAPRNDYTGYKSYGYNNCFQGAAGTYGWQAVTTVIGTPYRVSAYVMGYNGTASDVTLYACTGTASATPVGVLGSAHANASTWTYIYFDFIATTTTTNIGYYNDGKWAGIDKVYMAYPATVSSNNSDAGSVTGTDGYSTGDVVTISATPNTGYVFSGWSVLSGGATLADSAAATTTFTMPNNPVSVQANFSPKPNSNFVTINYSSSEGTVTGSTYYSPGETVTVKAVAKTGYIFSKWLVISGGVTLAQLENYQTTFVMPSNAVELKPVFRGNMIQNGDFENATMGSFTIPSWTTTNIEARNDYTGYKNYGFNACFYGNANANGWQAVTTVIGTSYRVSAYVMGYNGTASDVTLYACTGAASQNPVGVVGSAHASATTWTYVYFDFVATATTTNIGFYNDGKWAGIDNVRMTATPYTVTVSNSGGGSVTGSDAYLPGETVYISESSSLGYTFSGWEVLSGGVNLGTLGSYKTFTMPSNNVAINANFTSKANALTVATVTGGSVTGNAPYYNTGEAVSVKATPENGYIFSHWVATGITLVTPENQDQSFAMPASSVHMTPVYQKNMILNGDFETGTSASWVTNKFLDDHDTITVRNDYLGYKSSGYQAGINVSQLPIQPYAYQSVTVVSGATYRISAYVEGYTEASDITIFACTGAASATPVGVIGSNHVIAPSFTWELVTFDFVVPAGITSVNVGFYNDGKFAGVDKVAMYKIAASFNNFAISSNKKLTKLQPKTTVDEFLLAVDRIDADYVIANSGGTITGSAHLGTGTTITVTTTGIQNTYTAVIYGDVDGNGLIDITDLAAMKTHLLKSTPLEGVYLTAGDIFNKGKITISDLMAVKKQILGLYSISQG